MDDLGTVVPAGAIPQVNEALKITAVGNPQQVEQQLRDLIDQHQPDEVILTGHVYDHAARLRSFEIGAAAMRNITQAVAA